MKFRLLFVALLVVLCTAYFAYEPVRTRIPEIMGKPANLAELRTRVLPRLGAELDERGFSLGQPVFIRIFKEEDALELWMKTGSRFDLFKTYDICNFSGALGPKLKEGDRQSPEGFYRVSRAAMNPNSRFHLSFNLGFPNAYDQSHSRTGSYLMVHGNCVSIGCYAMTNAGIEEIYLLVEAAHNSGQRDVPVHAFPFRMTEDRLNRETGNRWFAFWNNLKTGYDLFERDGLPPSVSVSDQAYAFAPYSG